MPDSIKVWPRPNNIPVDGLKGMLHPTPRSSATSQDDMGQAQQDIHQERKLTGGLGSRKAWHNEEGPEQYDPLFEEYMYCGPGASLLGPDEDEEEPWYWQELDEEPPDYCMPCTPVRKSDEGEI